LPISSLAPPVAAGTPLKAMQVSCQKDERNSFWLLLCRYLITGAIWLASRHSASKGAGAPNILNSGLIAGSIF
jgi:hypothetical protein